MAYRIGATVELQNSFEPANPDEKMIYEDEAQGEITGIHETDANRYYVVFDSYTDEDGADLGFWVSGADLYVL